MHLSSKTPILLLIPIYWDNRRTQQPTLWLKQQMVATHTVLAYLNKEPHTTIGDPLTSPLQTELFVCTFELCSLFHLTMNFLIIPLCTTHLHNYQHMLTVFFNLSITWLLKDENENMPSPLCFKLLFCTIFEQIFSNVDKGRSVSRRFLKSIFG